MKGCNMNEEKKCLRCGGTNLQPSELQSTGKIYSRPKDAKLVTVLTTGVPVSALICLNCGHLELIVDTERVRAITKNP
jgi:predicted nucleic-acid-binding Zn-ribbon protein